MAQPANKQKSLVDTDMKKDKETKNSIVYTSRALSALYLPKMHVPEGEEIPDTIHVTITKA